MKIELVTRDDFLAIEAKLDQLLSILQNGNSCGDLNIYTTSQLATKLNVSTKTVQTWREERLIEFSQIHNKIFYTESAVEEFLKRHSIKRKHLSNS